MRGIARREEVLHMSESVRELAKQAGPQERPDIPALMAEIRERIKSDIDSSLDSRAGLSKAAVRFADENGISYGDMQRSEELKLLNRSFSFRGNISEASITTHRRGLLGRLLVKFKRFLTVFTRDAVLRDYLQAEEDFHINLVRFLNDMARYVDARDNQALSRLARVDDEKSLAIFGVEKQLRDLSVAFEGRVKTLDQMIRGLEGMLNNQATICNTTPPSAAEAPGSAAPADISYLLLENRFRGSEAEIERRLKVYPPMFATAKGKVLEIGSGRGELQRLLKSDKIESYGVDLDPAMVNIANAAGCNTQFGDGIAHLRSLPDRSLGGLVAIQVVEHLTRQQLHELFALAKAKLLPGSTVAFETINPQSVLALSSNYFRDPTHVWPMHPDTLGYMATLAGLAIKEVLPLSPVSPNQLLKEIPVDSSHLPAVKDAISRINENIKQLNALLYGSQDYCLVLEVP